MRFLCLFLLLPFLPACGAPKKEISSPIGSSVNLSTGPVVVIDAGHGGQNLGARANKPYCEEKRVALQTARLAKKYLSQLGYHVIMTRNTDEFLPLERRVEIANKAGAEIFVSLHFNSSRNPIAKGIEVYFYDGKSSHTRTAASRRMASFVLTQLIRRTHAVSRGVKSANFHVIRETKMPAILVEGGFISNPQERAKLKDPDYIDQLARAVADGVDQYFKKVCTGSGSILPQRKPI